MDLDHNRLAFLPNELGRLTELERLSLAGNPLSGVPAELAALPRLVVLRLDGCPLRPPVGDAYEAGGMDLLLRFLRGA